MPQPGHYYEIRGTGQAGLCIGATAESAVFAGHLFEDGRFDLFTVPSRRFGDLIEIAVAG